MRSRVTTKRKRVALIKKGSGLIVGLATITGVLGPFGDDQITASFNKHRVPTHMIGKWRYAWTLGNVQSLGTPIAYIHKKGAVTWVTLDSAASLKVGVIDSSTV